MANHPNLKDALLSCSELNIKAWFNEQRIHLYRQLENESTDGNLVGIKLREISKIESSLLQLRNK